MANIFRKNRQIILKYEPPLILVLFMSFWGGGFIVIPTLVSLFVIKGVDTLEISCRRVEPEIIDCQVNIIPKIKIFPGSSQNYTGIKGVDYLTETETTEDSDGFTTTTTYHYVIFTQISGVNKVEFDDRAKWIVTVINQFLNSEQEAFSIVESNKNGNILNPMYSNSIIKSRK